MNDGTAALARLRARAAERREAGLRRALRPRDAAGDGLLDLASNDYLGLTRDPRLAAAAARAAHAWGTGSTGSRLVTGSTRLHAELEEALGAFTGAASCLVFSSGYLANLGAVATLAHRDALIVSDRANHASIIDAARLSRARVEVVPHRDAAAVRKVLADREETDALVVTDAVFSVDGDLAPLPALHAAARDHGALLVVDEAHALGVVGEAGRGAVHAAGLAGAPDVVITATLSKSLGAQGGAVLGAPEVIQTLVDTGRSFIFDTGLAPPPAAAALEAVRLLGKDPGLAERARASAAAVTATVRAAGLPAGEPAAAVVSVPLGNPHHATAAAAACAERGVRLGCFRPPSVPVGRSCLRITARADLTEGDMERLGTALAAVAGRHMLDYDATGG
ncbi:MAG: aminotransferase class I/II-fold pyridoxal phosphate-dependent enzyme [Streptosporangiales bacterium]|nr:aminotransferase class I/II-fold pyridoxal phosphate-dependent enzyme [Streptosporangiales bacterium]